MPKRTAAFRKAGLQWQQQGTDNISVRPSLDKGSQLHVVILPDATAAALAGPSMGPAEQSLPGLTVDYSTTCLIGYQCISPSPG